MHIYDFFNKKNFLKSFEVFPPANELNVESAKPILDQLKQLDPDFISVTCGAGGTINKDNTIEVAKLIKNDYNIEALAHFTCLTLTKEQAKVRLKTLKDANVTNILALRGDKHFKDQEPNDFKYAKDLISAIDKKDFCVCATCYPEGHMDCYDINKEIEYTKIKVDCGASLLISQICFANQIVYPYIDKLRQSGVSAPFLAGVMPILSKQQVERMIYMCGISLPGKIVKILHKYQDNKDDLIKAGIEYAQNQIVDLKKNGVNGIHIYTMNNPKIAKELAKVVDN